MTRRRWLYIIQVSALFLIGAGFWWWAYTTRAWPISNPDAEDMAQIGRSWMHLDFTSRFMPLNALEYLHLRGYSTTPPWPSITRFPLTPALMAVVFSIVGPTTLGAALVSGILTAAALPLVYEIARRISGSDIAGWIAATYLALSGNLFWANTLGMSEPTTWFLLLAMVVVILRCKGRFRAALLSLILTLQILNRYTAVVMVPFVAAYIWFNSENRKRDMLSFAWAFLFLLAPWCIYLWSVTGNPFYNAQGNTLVAYRIPGGLNMLGWYSMSHIEIGPFVISHWADIWQRMQVSFKRLYEDLPWLMPPVGFAFFVAGLLRSQKRDVRWIQGVALVFFAAIAGSVSLLSYYIPRYYIVFVPLAMAFAGDMTWWIVKTSWPKAKSVVSYVLILACISLLMFRGIRFRTSFQNRESAGYNPHAYIDTAPDNQQAIDRYVPEDAIVASNLPWSVAWQANRFAIPIPPTPEQMASLEQRYNLFIGAIYLSSQFGIDNSPPEWEIWNTLRQQKSPLPGFALAHQFADGSVLYLREPTTP